MKAKLTKLFNSKHKYKVILELDGGHIKTVNFGASGYSDYTKHHDKARRARYISRHSSNEAWNDPTTAGFWSRWLLWDKQTIEEAKKNITKRFNVVFN